MSGGAQNSIFLRGRNWGYYDACVLYVLTKSFATSRVMEEDDSTYLSGVKMKVNVFRSWIGHSEVGRETDYFDLPC